MSNEKFKVKFGLAVGDTAATVDGTTGDIVTTGDLDVKGANITNSTGGLTITTASNGNIALTPNGTGEVDISIVDIDGGAIDGVTIGANSAGTGAFTSATVDNINIDGNAIISTNTDGNIDLTPNGTGEVNITKVDIDSGAIDGTTIGANSAAAATFTSATIDNINIDGNTIISTNTNGNIVLDPNGTGEVVVESNVDVNARVTADELQVDNININGNTIISTDTNGNIILDPNGTGNIALTLANGGNATNTHNYVFGAIRNATTQNNGNIWALNQSVNALPYKGVSLDNSGNTAVNAGTLIRNYSNTGGSAPRVVFERSRGTAASPVTLSSGDTIGGINFTGYQGSGWFNDSITTTPAVLQVTAAENWSSNTNVGTTFSVSMAPTATTISSGANLVTAISHNPQSAIYRSDAFTFRQGKTGTRDLLTLESNGRASFRDVSQSNNYNYFNYSPAPVTGDNSAALTLSMTTNDPNDFSLMNFITLRSTDGTNFTPTQNSDIIGAYKFNGNAYTSTTPGVPAGPAANILCYATENWSSTANGAGFSFSVIKRGTTTDLTTINSNSDNMTLKADNFYFEDSNNTTITSNKLNYTRTYGEFCYTAGNIVPAAADTIYAIPLDTTNDSSGTSISNTSRINIATPGRYKIIMSLQVKNADNSADHILRFWLRKNGNNVDNSATLVTPLKVQEQVVAMDWLVESDGDDYWEIVYYVNNTNVTFPFYAAGTSPVTYPAAPPIIVNIVPIGA